MSKDIVRNKTDKGYNVSEDELVNVTGGVSAYLTDFVVEDQDDENSSATVIDYGHSCTTDNTTAADLIDGNKNCGVKDTAATTLRKMSRGNKI